MSSAYGWTDDQILDLTLTRLWQVREVVIERLGDERKERNVRAEAVTRQLVLHIRLAAGDKKASKAAAQVKLFEDPGKSLTGAGRREVNEFQAGQFASRLGGGDPLDGLTPELLAAAYGG